LPLDKFLPSAGQGALAIEARDEEKNIAEIVAPLNHWQTWQSITAERTFLKTIGAGCRAPIAALGTINAATLILEAMIASPDGKEMLQASETGNAAAPAETGIRLANKMLDMGALKLITGAKYR
jgi:hydroxymethylbilane synthase